MEGFVLTGMMISLKNPWVLFDQFLEPLCCLRALTNQAVMFQDEMTHRISSLVTAAFVV